MTKYVCEACNREVDLDNKKPVECYHCGGRVLYKRATQKPVQLVAK